MVINKILKTIILIFLSFNIIGQTIYYRLFKDDKNLHYLAGVNISNAVGSAIFLKTQRPFIACAGGAIAGALIGIGKEAIWDKALGMGVCDNEDAYVTMWGSLVGAVTLRIGLHEFYGKRRVRVMSEEDFQFNMDYSLDKYKVKL